MSAGEPAPSIPIDPVRMQIMEAMWRMLSGHPLRATPGALSILQLVEEVGNDLVTKNDLDRKYEDLKTQFRALATQRTERLEPSTAREKALVSDLDRTTSELEVLKVRYAEASIERAEWKEAAEAFVRIIQVKEIEIAELQTSQRTSARRIARLEGENGEPRGALPPPQATSSRDMPAGIVPITRPRDRDS